MNPKFISISPNKIIYWIFFLLFKILFFKEACYTFLVLQKVLLKTVYFNLEVHISDSSLDTY